MDRLDSNELSGAVLARPLFLLIADSDTRRFSLEGPISDATAWETEAKRIRRNGRNVHCHHVDEDGARKMIARLRSDHFDEWPSRSIVDPPREPGLTCTCSAKIRNPLRGQVADHIPTMGRDRHHNAAERRN